MICWRALCRHDHLNPPIVSTLRDVDSLSVIALALATLAFVVQIILYVVQSNEITKSAIRSEEIYGATIKALASIEEKTEGAREAVTGSNARMLEALIGKSIPEAESAGVALDSAEFSNALAARIDSYLTTNFRSEELAENAHRLMSRSSKSTTGSNSTGERAIDKHRREHRELLEQFPKSASNFDAAVSVMSELDDESLEDLWRLWADERRYGLPAADHVSGGLSFLSMATSMTLSGVGLVRRVAVEWDSSSSVIVLTDLGRTAARILASDSVPDSQSEEVIGLRARLRRARIATEELRARI